MEQFIHLKKSGVVKIGIREEDGTDTGEFLEFDLESIELPLKIQECEEMHKKNMSYVKNQFIIIDKKQDHKGKKLLSSNEEEKIKVLSDFYKKEMEALDMFLGEGGTKKLLNGRNPYYSMYEDINEMLTPIMPILQKNVESIEDKIKSKYSKKEENVLE